MSVGVGGWAPRWGLVGYDSGDGVCVSSRHRGGEAGEIRLQATCVHSVTVRTEHVNIKRKITQETPGDGSGGSQRSTKFIETDPQLSKRAECPL